MLGSTTNTSSATNNSANDTNSNDENGLSKVSSTNYYHNYAVVEITSTADLIKYSRPDSTNPLGAYYGGGGNGSRDNPYIIQNIFANILSLRDPYGNPIDGIDIYHVQGFWEILNCTFFFAYPWSAYPISIGIGAGYGKIVNCSVVGTQDDYMISQEYPTIAGLYIYEASYIEVDNFWVSTFMPGDTTHVYPFYYGILISYSNHINITNSKVNGHFGITVYHSSSVTLEKNTITGPSDYNWNGYQNDFVNLMYGIWFQESNNSLIWENRIQNTFDTGILLDNSNHNTILENYLTGQHLLERGTSNSNQYSRLNGPQNSTYVQNNPDPGYYPGGISAYYSGEGFDNMPTGLFSTDLSELGLNSNSYWTTTGPVNVISNKSDAMGYNHEKVLSISKLLGTSSSSTTSDSLVPSGLTQKISGTIEFWLLVTGTGQTTISIINSDNSIAMQFQVANQQFYVWNGASYNPITGLAFETNNWYRISINESEDATYGTFSTSYQYNFQIYNSFDSNPVYTSSNLNFVTPNQQLAELQFSTNGNTGVQEEAYVDAIGYAWSSTTLSSINTQQQSTVGYDIGYQAGDNRQEGLVFNYNIQRDDASGTTYSYGYVLSKIGENTGAIYHPLNAFQFPYQSYPGTNPNTFDYFLYSTMEDKNWIFIVPMPADGAYSLTIVTTNSPNFEQYSGDLIWYSNTIYFSKYFDRGLQIFSHSENGQPYPPGSLLGPNDNLTVSETIRSFNWYNQSTWTTVYYSYKINNGPWTGPSLIGTGLGKFNISFTIYQKGNYSNFDTVYYYLTYKQYDNTSHLLNTYYLKNDLSTTSSETEAQQSAIIKKIAPIAYNLSLGYEVVYQSQLAINISGTTYNPDLEILHENVLLNFNNLTSAYSSNTEYNVTSAEYLLNTLLYVNTSNIARSEVNETSFPFSDGITSPFIIPLDWIPAFENGTFHTISIPLISFNYIDPGLNLSYTGDFVTLTYQGLDHWPDSPSHPYQEMLNFSLTTATQSIILRFDSSTGIMTYFEYVNNSVPLQSQKIVFALASNNAYPINLQIDQRQEVVSTGTTIIPQHLFSIIYDPPGDHSYGQITAGTTMTYSVEMSNSQTTTSKKCGTVALLCGIGNYIGYSNTKTQTTVKTTSSGNTLSVTFSTTLTSSQDTQNAALMDHGGDLYVGSGVIVTYYIMQLVSYIVVNTPDQPNNPVDDIRLFNNTPYINYELAFNSTFEVLGAYLDQYGLGSLRQDNIFLNNALSLNDMQYVQEIPNSPLLWTPTTSTDIEYSTSSTASTSYSINIHTTESSAFSFDSPLTSLLSSVSKSIPEVGSAISFAFDTLKSTPDIGLSVPTDLTFNSVSTSATTQNRQIIAHLEDDDGTPIGQNDQFDVHIYKDLRFNTFGYIIVTSDSYSSYPHEANTLDRRPPTISEITSQQQFAHGIAHLQVAGFDEETNVSYIKVYYSISPYFGIGAILIATINGSDPIALNSIYYNFTWNTNNLEGTFYLFVDTYDNAVPVKNNLLSNPYKIVIDNTPPNEAQVLVTQPYAGVYSLFAKASDNGTGIAYVQYWDGDPADASSSLIGTSSESSSGYNVMWVINQNGSDNGVHNIYVRVFDQAGNYLDSEPVLVTIGSKSTTNPITVTVTTSIPTTNTSSNGSFSSSNIIPYAIVTGVTLAIIVIPSVLVIQKYRKK